jgi:NAD(P)-dependent dehydrogenase (short-subunit alcohol dehydrogenase family)
VLVTGASTGIGAATVARLARDGCEVFAGVRRAEDGERLGRESPGRVHGVALDVTRAAEIEAAERELAGALAGRGLAGLVNNAGIALGGPLEYITPDILRRQLEVNVIGLHAVTRAFLPLVRQGRGRIVHVGCSPFIGPYAASKHAVEALADALRIELRPEGIHVALIEPGRVRTPIWSKGLERSSGLADSLPPDAQARYGRRIGAFRRMLERAPEQGMAPEVVAQAIAHALFDPSPRIRYLLGRDARTRLALVRLLPGRMMDALVLRVLARMERRVS